MYQSTVQEIPTPSYLLEQKTNNHDAAIRFLAITEWGTGQILDINNKGVSFGCLHPHFFPDEYHFDILDGKGTFIEKIKVRKVGEIFKNPADQSMEFELVVKVEFIELTPCQSDDLGHMLSSLEHVDYQ